MLLSFKHHYYANAPMMFLLSASIVLSSMIQQVMCSVQIEQEEIATSTSVEKNINNHHEEASGEEEEVEVEVEVTDQEVEAFLTSVVFVTIVTVILFTIFQRMTKTPSTDNNNNIQNSQDLRDLQLQQQLRRQEQTMQLRNRMIDPRQNRVNPDAPYRGLDEETAPMIPGPSPESNHKYLMDGILPFRHGTAKDYKLDAKQQGQKQTILTAILGNIPLSRGCNVVLTIRERDLIREEDALPLICSSITTLASEYNLFVIVDFETDKETDNGGNNNNNNRKQEIKQVQEQTLQAVPTNVLPRHRIIASKSVTGRIAFVRQLRPELVVDYDTEVQKQLTRFGFKVEIYGDGQGGFDKLCTLVG